MQGIFQKENTDKALKYGIYRHLPTYEKIIRNLVSFLLEKVINKIFFWGGQRLRILTIIVFLAGSICWHGVFDLKLPFQMESGLFMIGFCELGVLV